MKTPVSYSPHYGRHWLYSLLLHASLLCTGWWVLRDTTAPNYVAVDESIAWSLSRGGGGGGGGGGGRGDGKLGGGGGEGDGSALLQAHTNSGDMPVATMPASDTKPSSTAPSSTVSSYSAAMPTSSKQKQTKDRTKKAKMPHTATAKKIVANKKRELAAQLTQSTSIPKNNNIDAAETGGVGSGKGSGIGSGSGTGIGSGEGDGIGASKGSGTGGGSGSGLGSGTGDGIGSGSGGGVGSGAGTGTGSGSGSGVGTGEGSGVGSGVGAGTGAGFGAANGQAKASWRKVFSSYLSSRKRYPKQARRLRKEGTATVQASFSAQGNLTSAKIATSSGVAILDSAALKLVKNAAKAAAKKTQPQQALKLLIPVEYELL